MTAKPWLEHYDPGVPKTLEPYPRSPCSTTCARRRSSGPTTSRRSSRASVSRTVNSNGGATRSAHGLIANGVKKGDRVALVMPNTPQMVIAEFAVWKAGGIVASINPLYTAPELEHALKECGAEVAIVLTLFYDKVKAVQAKTPLKRIIATNIREYLPKVLMVAFMLLKEKKEGIA